VIGAMLRKEPQEIGGYAVSVPPMVGNGTYTRLPGQAEWRQATVPWPRTEWEVARSDSLSSRHGNVMVGDGPAFVSFEAAFCAFFYRAGPSNMAGQQPVWRVVRLDRRAWLHRVTIVPDKLKIVVKGMSLAGVRLELTTPTSRLVRPVGRTSRLTLPLPTGLAYNSLLMLRLGDEWLDFRYFPSPTPGRDPSVVWGQPSAELGVLIAGGEGQVVEFKQEVPMGDEPTKKKVVKSIAAFASDGGGTMLFGVADDTRVVGVDPTSLDKQMRAIVSMIRDSIDPEPPYALRAAEVDGKTLLVVEVAAGGRWYAVNPLKPEFYVRRGASTAPARLNEIESGFGYQQGSRYRTW
jgi:hypothetical protein